MTLEQDQHYMRAALNMARRGLGRTWPNPSVGCVIVKNGIIIGRGRTAERGRPHAEAAALAEAGPESQGATVYVTLEPCALHGRDAPCAEALVKARVRRVVIACIDPNPLVLGQGIEILKAAGIEVSFGILEDQARHFNAGFMLRITESRPLVTLKMATSVDHKIAPAPGQRQQMTGPMAQSRAHLERSLHDVVLAGIGTVLADDPMLNARVSGYHHPTVRVILDSSLRIPLESRIVQSARDFPLWIFHSEGPAGKVKSLEAAGVRLFVSDMHTGPLLNLLAAEGVTRVLVEGGAQIHTSFLKAGLYDRLLRFKAPLVVGLQGVDALDGFDISNIETDFGLQLEKTEALEQDLLEIYGRKA